MGREYGVQHASPAVMAQQDPRPGVDGRTKVIRDAVEVILVQRAGHHEDPPRPADLPRRRLRASERRHARIA
jgi:hypothetical protein